MNNKCVWLIGTGVMARDYVKVLKHLETSFLVIGRRDSTARKFEKMTGCKVMSGGLENFLSISPEIPSHVIVAVNVENLYQITKLLLEYGVKNILVEKPGAMNKKQLKDLTSFSKKKGANVLIAYNRRFYASVLKAKEIIVTGLDITSFHFEFTEWSHIIENLDKPKDVKEKWFLANSTHVIDLAFFLGGKPKKLCTFVSGNLDWHPASSVFAGAGMSDNGALFSYHANWESAGRWGVEI